MLSIGVQLSVSDFALVLRRYCIFLILETKFLDALKSKDYADITVPLPLLSL